MRAILDTSVLLAREEDSAIEAAGGNPRARVMDLWIAATALSENVPLFTCNREDFQILDQLIDVRML